MLESLVSDEDEDDLELDEFALVGDDTEELALVEDEVSEHPQLMHELSVDELECSWTM
jgi:hypothetical protein